MCQAISSEPVPVILVSNEVGMGLVSETGLARQFRDAQGRLNKAVTAVCDTVDFVQYLCLYLRPSGHLAAENLFLRKQLALFKERKIKPRSTDLATRLTMAFM